MTSRKPAHHQDTDLSEALTTHRHWLRTVIIARLGGARHADDVLQEVNVAAIEQRSPLRERAAIVGWLYQVAVRQSLLFRRRLGRQRRQLETLAAARSLSETQDQDPVHWLMANERRQLIRDALSQLVGRDREVLLLKYVEGWSYNQIARHTGRTERAVESHLHRARGKLRDQLHRLNVVEEPRVPVSSSGQTND